MDSTFIFSVIFKSVSGLVGYLERYEFGRHIRGYHLNIAFLHHVNCSKYLEICQAVT